MTTPHDILLCQRFLPEMGGSIRWMYEVYRRWSGPVDVITHDYFDHPPCTPEFPDKPVRPESGDVVTDANLRMDRQDIFMRDWGLENPGRLLRYLRMTHAVRKRLGMHRDKVVRVHAIHAVPEVVSLLPLKQLYGKRLKVLCYVHGEEVTACRTSRQLTLLMKQAHRMIDVMIANSQYTAQVVEPYMEGKPVTVINPGVKLDEFADAVQAGAALREERGWKDRLIVLTVGRLDPRKNQGTVIEAVGKLVERYPNLLYLIAGEGRNRNRWEEKVSAAGLEKHVQFLGSVDGAIKRALYGACDVFAMPAVRDGSDVEGFGMVFLEAAACGKPSIAGNTGGQADAVRNGETGLIVDGMDVREVTLALDRLLADEATRKTMGEAGCNHAQNFDWPKVVEKVHTLADNMIVDG
ncbi:MAG: glycosyltransferase family 4 protein [Phycisphaerales bacterium]|nr:glycosyltransferase family 4 protein [Phycisphaerales bacterium]